MLPCVAGKGAPGLVMQAMAKNSAGQQDIRHGVHARPSPAFTSRVHKRPTMASSFNYCRNRSQHTVINSTGNYHVGLQRNLRGKRHVMFNSNNAEAQYVKLLDESDGDGTTSAIEEPQTDVEIPENEEVPAQITTMKILRFVLPTLGIWIMNPILSLVDTAVVGQTSSVELAALGPGVLLCDHSTYVFNFLSIATANLLAIAFAAKDQKQAEKVLSESLMAALAMGLVSGVVYFCFAPQAIVLMAGVGGADLVGPAGVYVRIRALGLAAALVSSVLQAFFLAARNPVTPMLSVMFAGGLNLVGDLVLCNGFGMGIGGAAIATVAAQFATCGMLLAAAVKEQPKREGSPTSGWTMKLKAFIPSPASILRLVKFAGPVGLVLLTKVAMYTFLNGLASSVGPVGTGAHHIAFSVFIFFAVFGDAVSMAGQSFLPPTIGRPEANPEALGRRLLATGAVVGIGNCILASAVLLLAAGAFANSGAVVATVASLSPYVSAALFIHCTSMATESIMLAGRRYYYLVATYAANTALVFVLYSAAVKAGLSQLQSVWVGVITFQLVRLLTNSVVLASPFSVLKSKEPLKALS